MKKIISVLLSFVFLLSFSACGNPKSYDDCNADQKAILRSALDLGVDHPEIKHAEMSGDAVVMRDSAENEYVFIPMTFRIGRNEKSDVAMFQDCTFVEFAYAQTVSDLSLDEISQIKKCKAIWDGYIHFGMELVGNSIEAGDDSVQIGSVSIVEASSLSDLFWMYIG